MSIAVAYRCICATPFMIALAGTGPAAAENESRWKELVSAAAQQSSRTYVDGDRPGFACPNCGRLHVRSCKNTSPTPNDVFPDGYGSALVLSTN